MKSVSNNPLINSITLVINRDDRSEIVGLKKVILFAPFCQELSWGRCPTREYIGALGKAPEKGIYRHLGEGAQKGRIYRAPFFRALYILRRVSL